MFKIALGLLSLVCAAFGAGSAETTVPYQHHEHNRDAYTRPVPALTASQLRVFNFGNRLFNTNWVVAPASSNGFDGLGPLFNRVSCSGCHLRDGRGRPPIGTETELLSSLVRISIPGLKEMSDAQTWPSPAAVPNYGTQISDRAIPGVAPEAKIRVQWQTQSGQFADGSPYELRRPIITLSELGYGVLPNKIQTSFRVAPAVFGLGLLEAIPEASLLALEDESDRNQDGISGRANWVYSLALKKTAIGRFGWKSNAATLMDQNLDAALGDIGITSDLHPAENCLANQTACRKAIDGGKPELSQVFAEKLTLYVQMLGVPSPRTSSADSGLGEKRFAEFGCSACHIPELKTGTHPLSFLSEQTVNAYTDLLLHDMGEGLADHRPDHRANGREWRTAALWGLALTAVTNDHTLYLHDGRARNLSEAILWHGGEAEAAKERYRHADAKTRAALLAFLETL